MKITAIHRRFAKLVVDGLLSHRQIMKELHRSEKTYYNWILESDIIVEIEKEETLRKQEGKRLTVGQTRRVVLTLLKLTEVEYEKDEQGNIKQDKDGRPIEVGFKYNEETVRKACMDILDIAMPEDSKDGGIGGGSGTGSLEARFPIASIDSGDLSTLSRLLRQLAKNKRQS